MKTFDVVIVGNGILGLSLAHALNMQNKTLTIAVVGPASRPGCATTAAGAMLGCFGEVTRYTYRSLSALKKLEFAVQAKCLWPGWLESIHACNPLNDPLTIRPGTFVILNSRSGTIDNENYQAINRALIDYHEPFEDVDPATIPFLDPIMDYRPLLARYIPQEGYIAAQEVIAHLQSRLQACAQIALIDDEVQSIQVTANQIEAVHTRQEVLSSHTVILAAGAFSQRILDTLPDLKFKIPRILAGVGCSLMAEMNGHSLSHVIRSPNRAGACGIHVMGYEQNRIYIGATNYINYFPKSRHSLKYAYYLLQYAMEQINQQFHQADIIQWSTGCRPVSLDTFPLIGKTSIPHLWLLSATYRDGFHLSPLLAQEMASRILGSQNSWIGDFFPAERLPIQTMTRAQSIEEYILQTMASGYEHDMHLPRNGWDEQLPKLVKVSAQALYAQLDCDYGLPVEILLMLDRNPQLIPSFRSYFQAVSNFQRGGADAVLPFSLA